MGRLIAFPLLPRYAVQPRADAMPLQLRVVAAGRWPWPSDGNAAPLRPPPGWRPLGSRLTPVDARGGGIWSPRNFIRLQIGRGAGPVTDGTRTPPATSTSK